MSDLAPDSAEHTLSAPLRAGCVIVSNGRKALNGAPRERCVLNDPDATPAEYVFPDEQSARAARDARAARLGLIGRRMRQLNYVHVVFDPAPTGSGGPKDEIADALRYDPGANDAVTNQQFGMLWADAGWAGVETMLVEPPPAGSENRWSCLFVGKGITLIEKGRSR